MQHPHVGLPDKSIDPLSASPRCLLYVPGDRPDRFPGAENSGADGVIFDLEDSVGQGAKDAARTAVVTHLRSSSAQPRLMRLVRVNSGPTGLVDLDALADLDQLDAVIVAKAEPEQLASLDLAGRAVRAIALIETARAVMTVAQIASNAAVIALAMGEVDLAADLSIEVSRDGSELAPYRAHVVLASSAAGLMPPIGPVETTLKDLDGLRSSSLRLRNTGFAGRQAVHPSQVPIINEVWTPSAEEIHRAESLLRLAESSRGACVDEEGRMVDVAVLRGARRTLARAAALRGP